MIFRGSLKQKYKTTIKAKMKTNLQNAIQKKHNKHKDENGEKMIKINFTQSITLLNFPSNL